MAVLQAHGWPGNVRQLRNIVERMLILAADDPTEAITADLLPSDLGANAPGAAAGRGDLVISLPLREAREMFEREYLVAQINRFGGNISRTAAFIGMERSALHRKLKSLGVGSARLRREGLNGESWNARIRGPRRLCQRPLSCRTARPRVHIEDRGLQFADGVYEVCRMCGGRLVDEEAHLDRLERRLGEIGMAMPMAPRRAQAGDARDGAPQPHARRLALSAGDARRVPARPCHSRRCAAARR